MRESINEPVSVVFYYNAARRQVQPYRLTWSNNDYRLGKVDFWHKTKRGSTIIHHFSLADIDASMYFKLALDADSLQWTIEEYMPATEARVHYDSWGA